jgi:ADP-ribosylglycohydrolase
MRLLPTVMYAFWDGEFDIKKSFKAAKISALITHKHPENVQASYDYIVAAKMILSDIEIPLENHEHISELGEGWTAQECVNMAIYAFKSAKTFDELLEISIAHDGDSDSVAAIAGSLWGLAGREVPQEYIDKLVEMDAIKYVIDNYINPTT